MRQLFGTDGMRGVAGEYPLDPRTCYALGVALARWIGTKHLEPEVIIGMDTRESSTWISENVAGGLVEGGVRPRLAGLITTPGLAHEARVGPFAAGVMISASHNPYRDNGLKIIDHSGFKLPDEQEHILESHMFEWTASAQAAQPRAIEVNPDLGRMYLDHLAATFPGKLEGLRIVIDAANGAASSLAVELFQRLGAEPDCIHCAPDGRNINLDCGSQHLESLKARVLETGAELGVAFDGDADRAMFVSHTGKVVDGDGVLLICARPMHQQGHLREVIATVMSNLGLERALKRQGIGMVRTPVGDKYVLEEMIRRDAPLGGEQSGHIIFREYATTGDGMLTALRVLDVMRSTGSDLDALTADLESYPQLLVNVRVQQRRPLNELDSVNREIRRTEEEFGDSGRVLVRFSGTEPLARVMVEGPTLDRVHHNANAIAAAIRVELGG